MHELGIVNGLLREDCSFVLQAYSDEALTIIRKQKDMIDKLQRDHDVRCSR